MTSRHRHRSRHVRRCGEIKLRVFTTAIIYVHPSMVLIFHQSFTRFTPFVKPTCSTNLYTFPSQTVGTCRVHCPHVKHVWSGFVSFQPCARARVCACACVTLVYCSQKYKRIELVTARRNARIVSAVLATAIPFVCPSVCLSVTRRYCVKTTARSTVQLALSDSKMCLVL